MLLYYLLIPEHCPVDYYHPFHCFADLGIEALVVRFELINNIVKLVLYLLVCVQIFSDLLEVIPIMDVGYNYVVLNICYQIVDELKVLNVLIGEEFVVQIVSYAVYILLYEKELSLRELIRLRHLKDAYYVS